MGWLSGALRNLCGLVFWCAVLVGLGSAMIAVLFPGVAGAAGATVVGMIFVAFISMRLNTVLLVGEEGISAYDRR
jgi:hypothetical protein